MDRKEFIEQLEKLLEEMVKYYDEPEYYAERIRKLANLLK